MTQVNSPGSIFKTNTKGLPQVKGHHGLLTQIMDPLKGETTEQTTATRKTATTTKEGQRWQRLQMVMMKQKLRRTINAPYEVSSMETDNAKKRRNNGSPVLTAKRLVCQNQKHPAIRKTHATTRVASGHSNPRTQTTQIPTRQQ